MPPTFPFRVRPDDPKQHTGETRPPKTTRRGRDWQAENLEALAKSKATLPEVLDRKTAARQTLGELVAAMPGYGPKTAPRFLREHAGLSPSLRAGDLTEAQRERLERAVADA